MNTPSFGQLEQRFFRMRKILWGTLFGTLGMYIGVGFFIKNQMLLDPFVVPSENPGLYHSMQAGLLVLGAGQLWLAGFLRKKEWGRPRMSPAEQLKITVTQWEKLNDAQRSALSEMQKRFAAEIPSWALTEGVAIYGFILYFLFADLNDLLIFVVVAAAGMVCYRPCPVASSRTLHSS